MIMKLKTVTVTFQYVIVVGDEDNAMQREDVAKQYLNTALLSEKPTFTYDDYDRNAPLIGWDGYCTPYGASGGKCISQILKANKSE